MKKKLLIVAGVVLGGVALVWLLTPKPTNWAQLPFMSKLQFLLMRAKASTVDGSQYE